MRNSGPTRVYHPLQTCGAKHWRVFAPPHPSRKPAADPLARGKAADALTLSELGEPLIDTVLTPGQLLYMPAGFPHTTDTLNLGEPAPPAAADDSVHLTIGIDTHIWGLDYLGARAGALKRAALPDQCTATKLPEEAHWKLMGIPPHLGFLRRHAAAHAAADPDATAEDAAAAAAVAELVAAAREAEPARWAEHDDASLAALLDAPAVAAQLVKHAAAVTEVCRGMYDDALRGTGKAPPGLPDVSVFRVKPHMQARAQFSGRNSFVAIRGAEIRNSLTLPAAPFTETRRRDGVAPAVVRAQGRRRQERLRRRQGEGGGGRHGRRGGAKVEVGREESGEGEGEGEEEEEVDRASSLRP